MLYGGVFFALTLSLSLALPSPFSKPYPSLIALTLLPSLAVPLVVLRTLAVTITPAQAFTLTLEKVLTLCCSCSNPGTKQNHHWSQNQEQNQDGSIFGSSLP